MPDATEFALIETIKTQLSLSHAITKRFIAQR